jgi:hypothetical protein
MTLIGGASPSGSADFTRSGRCGGPVRNVAALGDQAATGRILAVRGELALA